MEQDIRVAFFPDAYDEINGVANTSRQFAAFAKKRGIPFLIICGGTEGATRKEGSVTRRIFRRGRIGFPLDKEHDFDLLFWRHYSDVEKEVLKFSPDVVHITGPSDVGMLGAFVAHRMQIPLAASWHTNLHEYAERRASTIFQHFSPEAKCWMGRTVREISLSAIMGFYKLAQTLFAPNPELMDLLERATGKSVFPMFRGVDSTLFTPEMRDRTDGEFVVGYVGRLTVEKNIRFLRELEASLASNVDLNMRFSIVGQGAEEPWLRANMRKATFAGVLKGAALARAYANMDVFVFPSKTDAFGNVVLEALCSGVPAIVTESGGPQFLIRQGETGFVARSASEFAGYIRHLSENRDRLRVMRTAARAHALGACWDRIFEGVYGNYQRGVRTSRIEFRRDPNARPQPGIAASSSN